METTKLVNPRGHILNDNDAGADYLGHTVYAEALTETIVNVETPVTIGVFARWGSGKSFLVKHVCSLLDKRQREREATLRRVKSAQGRAKCCWTLFLLAIVAWLLIALAIAASAPEFVYKHIQNVQQLVADDGPLPTPAASGNATWRKANFTARALKFKEEQHLGSIHAIEIGSLIGMTLIVVVVCVVMCCAVDLRWPSFARNFKLIAFAAFTKLPIGHPAKTFVRVDDGSVRLQFDPNLEAGGHDPAAQLPRRYIFVKFSAWEYAGSDNLWAGIATNLSDAIETEFGCVVSRLFRIFDLDVISENDAAVAAKTQRRENVLLVRFGRAHSEREMLTVAGAYGAVIRLRPYDVYAAERQKKKKKDGNQALFPNWWAVEYTDALEAQSAQRFLKRYGVQAQFGPPRGPEANEGAPNGPHDIGMTDLSPHDETVTLVASSALEERGSGGGEVKGRSGFWRHFFSYPKKKCHFPVLYWFVLLILSAIVLPIITYHVARHLHLSVFKSARAVPVAVQIFAWLPGTAGAMYVILSFLWAMLHSQRSRIKSACTKEGLSCALGMMDKIKHEVHVISKLIHCAEFTHGKNYTVVIAIDDLDRVPQDKVKSVLEAVNILLSDFSSPFVCLIALDSRVAVKCIEEGMGKALLNANVNGHEYLKKIINLPFCLPEAVGDSKKRFIEGLIDQTDHTNTLRRDDTDQHEGDDQFQHRAVDSNGNVVYRETVLSDVPLENGDVQTDSGARPRRDQVDGGAASSVATGAQGTLVTERELSGKRFLFHCRQFLQTDELIRQHLQGNPRNIKRIFNVLSLTSVIINCSKREEHRRQILRDVGRATVHRQASNSDNRTQRPQQPLQVNATETSRSLELARDIVRWIVLTDQWPYRMSYILQVIDDADQRKRAGRSDEDIPDHISLFAIYESRVLSEITESSDENKSLLSLDADPDIFYSFIKRLEAPERGKGMDKGKAKRLKQYTVNLDHSLRQSIAHQRGLADLNRNKPNEAASQHDETASQSSVEAQATGCEASPSQPPLRQSGPTVFAHLGLPNAQYQRPFSSPVDAQVHDNHVMVDG